MPADRLGELLGLDLPRVHQLIAARACLSRDGEPSPALTQTLAKHPALTLSLLRPDGTDPDRAVQLFESLLAEAPAHPWFEDLLAKAADYPPSLLNQFFEAALTAGKVDADRVVRTQGPQLLELFAGQSGLDRVGTLFLATPPADLLRNRGVLDFLGKLRDEPQVGDDLKGRIAAVQAVRGWLDAPAFTPEALKPVAEALAVSPPALPTVAKGELFETVAAQLLHRTSDPSLQADLEAALVHFGPVLANDPTDLYENLLRDLRGRTDFGRHPNLVQTFLAVALGATTDPALSGELGGLDGHAFAIASDAAKRGGNRLLRAIDRRSESWPRAARTQWAFLHAAVQPRGFRGLLRDAGLVLVGSRSGDGGVVGGEGVRTASVGRVESSRPTVGASSGLEDSTRPTTSPRSRSVNSAVPAVPPRSAGRTFPSVSTASTAFTIRSAASASPKSLSISTAGRISGSGLAGPAGPPRGSPRTPPRTPAPRRRG